MHNQKTIRRLSQQEVFSRAIANAQAELCAQVEPYIVPLANMLGATPQAVPPHILSLLPDNELFLCGVDDYLVAVIALALGAQKGRISIFRPEGTEGTDISEHLQAVLDTAFGALNMHKVSIETVRGLDVTTAMHVGFRKVGVKKAEVLIEGVPVDIVLLERLSPALVPQEPEIEEEADEERPAAKVTRFDKDKTPKPTKEQSLALLRLAPSEETEDKTEEEQGFEVIETVQM